MHRKVHSLDVYLNEQEVRRGNRRIYLEAHLLPRKEDKTGYKPYGVVVKSVSLDVLESFEHL